MDEYEYEGAYVSRETHPNGTCPSYRSLDDNVWLLQSGFFILSMQTGFALLEASAIRKLNATNIFYKNIMDLCVGGIGWYMLGWGVAYGNDLGGFMGTTGFFPDEHIDLGSFFFQFTFATTAATIDSGAVVERMKVSVYLMMSFFMCIWVYPVVAHWVWSSDGWLYKRGFVDFAGSGVVHMIGGISGLVNTWYLGPRLGVHDYFPEGEWPFTARQVKICRDVFKSEGIYECLGTLMLWFGWYSFNCGSTLQITGGVHNMAAQVAFTTSLAPIFGAVAGSFYSVLMNNYIIVPHVSSAILGSLVGITAFPHVVAPGWAIVTGVLCGVGANSAAMLVDRLGLDDPVHVIPIHFVCGAMGLFCAGLFAETRHCSYVTLEMGGLVTTGSADLLIVQIIGIFAILGWTAANMLLFLVVTDKLLGIKPRVDPTIEFLGMDLCEHGVDHFAFVTSMFELQRTILKKIKQAKHEADQGSKLETSSASNGKGKVAPHPAEVLKGADVHADNVVKKLGTTMSKRVLESVGGAWLNAENSGQLAAKRKGVARELQGLIGTEGSTVGFTSRSNATNMKT